jgi:hypothetical protein
MTECNQKAKEKKSTAARGRALYKHRLGILISYINNKPLGLNVAAEWIFFRGKFAGLHRSDMKGAILALRP